MAAKNREALQKSDGQAVYAWDKWTARPALINGIMNADEQENIAS